MGTELDLFFFPRAYEVCYCVNKHCLLFWVTVDSVTVIDKHVKTRAQPI